jgi:hypothetical protein
MSKRSLRNWSRSSSKTRVRATEQALNENLAGVQSTLVPVEPGELGAELASMRSLIQTLEQLPGQAWSSQPDTARTRSTSAVASRRAGRGHRLRITPGVSGALATAALAFAIGALIHPFSETTHSRASGPTGTAPVVLKPHPGTFNGSRAVAYMRGRDQMLLRIRDLPRSAPGTYYELWLMTSTTDLVPVTSFRIRASSKQSLRLLLPDDPSHYKYLDISVQQLGNGGAISKENVLRGSIPA